MLTPLRVLILEDNPGDAELMLYELRQANFTPDWTRVETEADYLAHLDEALDLILSDYHLPQFDGLRALQHLRARGLEIPFIVVSGAISEEVAVACMKQGAADYLFKDRLARLGPAVVHALEQKRLCNEKQQAEEAKARLIAILEATTDFVGICDVNRRPLYLNSGGRTMVGIGEDEDSVYALIDDSHPKWARALILNEGIPSAIRDGTWVGETALLHRDGREIPVSQVIIAHKTSDGTLEYLSTIARDITERKRYENHLEVAVEQRTRELKATNEALEVASRHKSEFLANMSHELRTPLNSVIGFAELLQDLTFGALSEQQARYAHNIQVSGRHLLALIDDLLDLSKIEAGKLELRLEPLILYEVLTVALDAIRPLAEPKRLTLTLHAEQAPATLTADPLRLTQILYNLLSNAVKFTPEGGQITVTAKVVPSSECQVSGIEPGTPKSPDLVEISVTDTGIGITADDLPKLFQPFTQLEPALVKRQQGTGLGLSLTKHLVELHGGMIAAASAGGGHGSTFTVWLPLKPQASPELRGKMTQATILVVEDHQMSRELVVAVLAAAGYTVLGAEDGRGLIERVKRERPNLILMDLQLPHIDGFTLTRQLKADAETRKIPVLAATAYAQPEQEARTLEAGCAGYLTKPLDTQTLLKTVARILDR